jgi:hypothetical protein
MAEHRSVPTELPPTELSSTVRTRHRRLREQGRTERAELDAVLRAGVICHLARGAGRRERCLTEHLVPVKIRTGPPDDGDGPDAALGLWAGVLPISLNWHDPSPDQRLPPGTPVPPHIARRAGPPS